MLQTERATKGFCVASERRTLLAVCAMRWLTRRPPQAGRSVLRACRAVLLTHRWDASAWRPTGGKTLAPMSLEGHSEVSLNLMVQGRVPRESPYEVRERVLGTPLFHPLSKRSTMSWRLTTRNDSSPQIQSNFEPGASKKTSVAAPETPNHAD